MMTSVKRRIIWLWLLTALLGGTWSQLPAAEPSALQAEESSALEAAGFVESAPLPISEPMPLQAEGLTAEEVLQQVERRFHEAVAMELAFTIVDGQGGRQQGRIALQGERFKLSTPGVTTWFDGQTQATYLEQSEEVNLSEPTAEELQSIHPYAWLSIYKQGYRIKFKGNPHGGSHYVVVLTATLTRQEIRCVMLTIDKQNFALKRMSLVYRGGETVAIAVNQQQMMSAPWPESMFCFDAKEYPDVEVVDLR